MSPAALMIVGVWSDMRATFDWPPPAWANTVSWSLRSYSPLSRADLSRVLDQPQFWLTLVRPLAAEGICTPDAIRNGRDAASNRSSWLTRSRLVRRRSP
ncbi:hypothetical protein D3C73_1524290 [compost metagenome]